MPNTLLNCLTSLVEDIDDDNDNWWDTNETACQTNPLSSSSVPVDTDGDWVCNFVDTDDDAMVGVMWMKPCANPQCLVFIATGTSSSYWSLPRYNIPVDLVIDEYGLRMLGSHNNTTLVIQPCGLTPTQQISAITMSTVMLFPALAIIGTHQLSWKFTMVTLFILAIWVYRQSVTSTSFGTPSQFISTTTGARSI